MMNYKVIFHIDEVMKWHMLLGNVSNLIKALEGHTLSVEVLANAEAVRLYLKSSTTADEEQRLLNLSKQGVVFAACQNALNGLGIQVSELLDFVVVVPSGVAELTIKQHESYAYIKP